MGLFFGHLYHLIHCQVKIELQGSQEHIHQPAPSSPIAAPMHMHVDVHNVLLYSKFGKSRFLEPISLAICVTAALIKCTICSLLS